MFTVKGGKRVFLSMSFSRLCCSSKLPKTASFQALTNSSVWSYSPGPSSSFIFILTIRRLFLFCCGAMNSHSHTNLLRLSDKKKEKKRTTLYVHGPFLIIQESQGRRQTPHLLHPPHWLVSIATAGGWGGRVSVYAICFEALEPRPPAGRRCQWVHYRTLFLSTPSSDNGSYPFQWNLIREQLEEAEEDSYWW